jgi:hypothetical protein
VVDDIGAVVYRFTVEARLRILRAGDVFPDAVAFLRCQSFPEHPFCRGTSGLDDLRGGDGWLKSDGVDLFASCRKDNGGLRF